MVILIAAMFVYFFASLMTIICVVSFCVYCLLNSNILIMLEQKDALCGGPLPNLLNDEHTTHLYNNLEVIAELMTSCMRLALY